MNCTAGKCEICGIELTLSEPKHNFPDVPFFIRTNCLDCGQPNREPLLTGYLYHIMAVVFCLELIVAIWYLVKDKQIRKY